MSQKSSAMKTPQYVPQALMSDSLLTLVLALFMERNHDLVGD